MKQKNKFDFRFINLPQDLWLKISEIESLRGRWSGGQSLHPVVLGRLKRSVLVTSTGASTRIEGSSISDVDIEKLLNQVNIQTFGNRDQQEVGGYYELLENVFNSYDSLKFNESIILHFHKELLKYVEKDVLHRGKYKQQENAVGIVRDGNTKIIFETTKAYLTPKEMNELVNWTIDSFTQKTIHPLLIIANFLVEFLLIHPFTDGNGRLSRILTNLLLLQSGYAFMPYVSHEKIIEDNKTNYYLALRHTQKTLRSQKPDLTPWLNFFLDTLLVQSRSAIALFNRANIESTFSALQLKVWEEFGKNDTVTPRLLTQVTLVLRPTINQILTKLLSLNLIEKLGAGRSTHYRKL